MKPSDNPMVKLLADLVGGGRDAVHLWRELAGLGKLRTELRALFRGTEDPAAPKPVLGHRWKLLKRSGRRAADHRYH